MRFTVIIPARYASTRFPGKPLADVGGKPMVVRVAERARASGADEVLVATDHPGIAAAVAEHGYEPVMTRPRHATGTDRIAEVVARRRLPPGRIVVNVQGDEPFLPPRLIEQAAHLLDHDAAAGFATLSAPVGSLHEFLDPNVVKVVTARDGAALYFSRAPIPWTRDGSAGGYASQAEFAGAQRHVGIYAYRVAALRRITRLPPSDLEQREKLEQLRALQNGIRIVVGACIELPAPGVDTEDDLHRAREWARAMTASPRS